MTLGVQQIFLTGSRLRALGASVGSNLDAPDTEDDISDLQFFRTLGFDKVVRTDVSDYEGADVIFDLNSPSCPDEIKGKCDIVVDGGTIEHVFHLPNALRNIFEFLNVGGRVIHISPSSNHVDHGFYMFSPTLFWDFYTANDFEIETFKFFRYTPRHDRDPWVFGDYKPGCLDRVNFGGLGPGLFGIAMIATKTRNSTGDRVPQQNFYVRAQAQTELNPPSREKPKVQPFKRPKVRPFKMLKRWLRKSRFPLKVSDKI